MDAAHCQDRHQRGEVWHSAVDLKMMETPGFKRLELRWPDGTRLTNGNLPSEVVSPLTAAFLDDPTPRES